MANNKNCKTAGAFRSGTASQPERRTTGNLDLTALSHLPALRDKAVHILAGLADGMDYRQYQGKKLQQKPGGRIVSIPVGRYRLLCLAGKNAEPLALYSHEQYNHLVQGGAARLAHMEQRYA